MRRRPDLIVPIRDRRQHKRVLTLRNFCLLLLAIVIFFAGITIESNLRHSTPGEYGRLFGKQVSGQADVAPRKVEIVREAPVADQTAADPLLVGPAAREQYLRVDGSQTVLSNGVMTAQPLDAPRGNGPVIVSGPGGVTIVRGEAPPRPTLSGGIFRQ